MPKPKAYEREVDLCAAFVAALDDKWTPYAETAGWDLLLVRKADGFQVGIQAKLKLNPLVLGQALDQYVHFHAEHAGPDCRAILVPWGEVNVGLEFIARWIGITVIKMEKQPERKSLRAKFSPDLPDGKDWTTDPWQEQCPPRRHELPEYIPDVRAGDKAPLQLTSWKIKAIKLCILLDERGYVTRRDFSHLRLDPRIWTAAAGWLVVEHGRYIRGPRTPNLQAQHPVVWEEIKKDIDKWRPPNLFKDAKAAQPALPLDTPALPQPAPSSPRRSARPSPA